MKKKSAYKKYLLICAAVIFFTAGCSPRKENDKAFYYWKTDYRITAEEETLLKNLGVNKMYIRLFDVDWDKAKSVPMPVGVISFTSRVDTSLNIVPVIYITNKTLKNISGKDIPDLADKIFSLSNQIAKAKNIDYKEFQLDCDWSESTKDKYFILVEGIKKKLHAENKIISATIRLHQIKYPERTGIPPVDRGMLMFYNMGKVGAQTNVNSIYNSTDAGKYTAYIEDYKLPLDAVLPVFGWVIQIRSGKVVNALSREFIADIKDEERFELWPEKTYVAKSSFLLHGKYIMKGDYLKVEEVLPDLSITAAEKLAENLSNQKRTVALFDLDSLIMVNYHEKDFKKIFGTFN